MMPLNMIGIGNSADIVKVSGNDEIRRYLGNLGFVPGSKVTLLADNMGNIIVSVKDSRIAINKDMACHIMV